MQYKMERKETTSTILQKSPSSEMVRVDESQKQVAVASPKRDVKSTAVVKWSATQVPVALSELRRNTDLNYTPPNWLRSRSREEEHLKDLPWKRHSECSSFVMANCYPDYAGEVDVISDAENIKRLLKIPFENSHASLMVHRVGCTLLLDNFDIHQHLLRRDSENWHWLYQFYKNTVMTSADEVKYVPREAKTQEVLQKKLMFSKFLYQSLMENGSRESEDSQLDRTHQVSPSPSPSPVVQQHFVADRLPAIDMVQFDGHAEFHRQMLWTFEDLRMLIGADLPVFSVGDHPCVSLRLRDMSQPINVVTGLDYWLDNLMCNVPEVAMCYHDSGFVQKYELIKTEDIPKLESSKFNPQTVKDVASNILAFLRNSATKEGHTYWLYKCKRSDVVKLYDLTTLCGDSVPNRGVTPFTVPVAMLLYRVARKLRVKVNSSRHIPHIKAMLQTSLQLLDDVEHAEVFTSALYLLSDLYVPDGCLDNEWVAVTPDSPSPDHSGIEASTHSTGKSLSEQNSDEEEGEEEESARAEVEVSVKDLMNPPKEGLHTLRQPRLEGITGTPDERCQDGLHCVRKGLSCLERDLVAKMQRAHHSSSIVEEQRTCNACEAIPLKYTSLKDLQDAAESGTLILRSAAPLSENVAVEGSWHHLSKALLLRKASMANCVLANEFLANKQYGCSLKRLRYAIHCFEAMVHLKPDKKSANVKLESQLLMTAAEVRHHLSQITSHEEHVRGYDDMTEEDAAILDSAQTTVPVPGMAWTYKWTTSRSENLNTALRCLDIVREMCGQQPQTASVKALMQDVVQKSSAIYNELGIDAMAITQAMAVAYEGADAIQDSQSGGEKGSGNFSDIVREWERSMGYFQRSLEGFHKVKDVRNKTLVLLNIVKLQKIGANIHMQGLGKSRFEFGSQERHHFNEVFEYYNRVMECLSTAAPDQWNRVLWEFSGTYVDLAILLLQFPPSSTDKAKVRQEAAELYRKAIKKCHRMSVEEGQEWWGPCKDRIATLEFNIGGLHVSAGTILTSNKHTAAFEKAEACFSKSAELFLQLRKYFKFLQVQCRRLYQYQSHYGNENCDAQSLQAMLLIALECQQALQDLASAGFAQDFDSLDHEFSNPKSVLEHLVQSTLYVLKQLLKRATRLKLSQEQLQLRDLYKKSLELSTQIAKDKLNIDDKYRLASELLNCIKQDYKWAR